MKYYCIKGVYLRVNENNVVKVDARPKSGDKDIKITSEIWRKPYLDRMVNNEKEIDKATFVEKLVEATKGIFDDCDLKF